MEKIEVPEEVQKKINELVKKATQSKELENFYKNERIDAENELLEVLSIDTNTKGTESFDFPTYKITCKKNENEKIDTDILEKMIMENQDLHIEMYFKRTYKKDAKLFKMAPPDVKAMMDMAITTSMAKPSFEIALKAVNTANLK